MDTASPGPEGGHQRLERSNVPGMADQQGQRERLGRRPQGALDQLANRAHCTGRGRGSELR